MASASLRLLAGRVSQPVIVSGSAGNGSGGGAGLGGGGRSTCAGSWGCPASSAGGGWFSIRRHYRGVEELSEISERDTAWFGVSESFQEFVTCTKTFSMGDDTNLV